MKDILETAFAESNINFDNNDYLLMALLKRMNMLFEINKKNFNLIMDRIGSLEINTKPRMYPSPS